MDAAERIMTLAYRLRYAFVSVRRRGIFGYETTAAQSALDREVPDWRTNDETTQSRLQTAQVISNRLRENKDDWNEIWTLKPIALALFGQSLENDLQALWEHHTRIYVSVSEMAEDDGRDRDYTVSLRRSVFGGPEDELTKSVEVTIKSLEARLLPILRTPAATASEIANM